MRISDWSSDVCSSDLPTKQVRDYAEMPSLFTQDRQSKGSYVAVPEVSSENRRFIPIAFLDESTVASNKIQMVVGGTLFHFGILTSHINMAWMRAGGSCKERRVGKECVSTGQAGWKTY